MAYSVNFYRLATKTNKAVLLLEGGAEGTGQRDLGGTDYVASYFKTNPITGKLINLFFHLLLYFLCYCCFRLVEYTN